MNVKATSEDTNLRLISPSDNASVGRMARRVPKAAARKAAGAGRRATMASSQPGQYELARPDTMGRVRPLRVGQGASARHGGKLSARETWASEDADREFRDHPRSKRVWSRPLRRHIDWAGLPETFGDCPEGPCPYVRCRHHMSVEVERDGSMTIYREGPWPMQDKLDSAADAIVNGDFETCSLRFADRGGMGTGAISEAMSLDVNRVRALERSALAKLAERIDLGGLTPAEVMEALRGPDGPTWPDGGGYESS